jgi:hypothetical protein
VGVASSVQLPDTCEAESRRGPSQSRCETAPAERLLHKTHTSLRGSQPCFLLGQDLEQLGQHLRRYGIDEVVPSAGHRGPRTGALCGHVVTHDAGQRHRMSGEHRVPAVVGGRQVQQP